MSHWQGLFFRVFLLVFGAVMDRVVPRSKDQAGFFRGHDDPGRLASARALMMSIFISWILTMSVTNAATLVATSGVVGGLADAAIWLSIPVAGLVIRRLRTREGATGLVPLLSGKYGRGAALLFTAAVLFYCLEGGLRRSIFPAGSTLDSTFTSLSKLVAREPPLLAGRLPSPNALTVGALNRVAPALLGNLPMVAGTDILKATTISGTMVIGLAPIFPFSARVGYSPLSIHRAFWPGIALGLMQAMNLIPAGRAIGTGTGTGKYAILLGTKLYGLGPCTAALFLPLLLHRYRAGSAVVGAGSSA